MMRRLVLSCSVLLFLFTVSLKADVSSNKKVRLVYFVPSDRHPRERQAIALRELLKEAQRFFANEMERHGFGRKTFNFEYDDQGEPIVHEIRGEFGQNYYNRRDQGYPLEALIWKEIVPYFDDLHHVFLVAMDPSVNIFGGLGALSFSTDKKYVFGYVFSDPFDPSLGGFALKHRDITDGEQSIGGLAILSAGDVGPHLLGLTLHELGHAFGLEHDYRELGDTNYLGDIDYIVGTGKQNRLSGCSAEWLSVHNFFTPEQTYDRDAGSIELVQADLFAKDLVRFRFEVADGDGLHQAQLLVPEILEWGGWGPYRLFNCQELMGEGSVQFLVKKEELVDRVTLQVIDKEGNVTWATFSLHLDSLPFAGDGLDVNGDGTVDLLDVAFISDHYGRMGNHRSDVNGDAVVDVADILLVASFASSLPTRLVKLFAFEDVVKWLDDADAVSLESKVYRDGFIVLTHLLDKLTLLSSQTAVVGDNPKVLSGHTRPVWSIAFSPDSALLASGSFDRTVRLWSVDTGELLDVFIGHKSDTFTVAFSPDGQTLASGGWDGTVRLWDIGTGEQKKVLISRWHAVSSVAFSPTGHVLAGGTASSVVVLWDTATWQVEKILEGHGGVVDSVLFSPDGMKLASGSRDATVRVWDPHSGQLLHTLRGHTGHVARMAFSPNGNLFASGSLDRNVRLWDPHTGDFKEEPVGYAGGYNPVAFTPDGTTLVIGNRGIWLWDIERKERTKVVDETLPGSFSIAFSPNGNLFASGGVDHNVRLWDSDYIVSSDHRVDVNREYTLSIPAGISLIHVPLKVTAVDGVAQTVESISDLYDTLGGASTVNFLITYDASTQAWLSYFVPSDKGGPGDRTLTDDTGIIAGLRAPASVHLRGDALGTDGSGTITLNQGLNLVGLPLNDSRITRVSDLFTLDGIGGNVPVIILTDGGEFKLVGRAGDPGDIAITGGQAFIMTASQDATVAISGDAWANDSGTAAAPPVTHKGIEVGNTTPVLGLRGAIIDEGTGLNNAGFRVTLKNLSTGRTVAAVTAPDEVGYRSTVVDIERGCAATVGDILELSAQSPNPFVGVEPLRYTITTEDVKQSLIQLPELVAYEIPAETQLLRNYPNPFNPETWIPYRLAEDAFVTLTIYDGTGQAVRTIDVGHQIAAVYEDRSKAVYWDGRNGLGEQVTSGVYFYHLSAGDYSATRKMLILK